MAEPAAARVAVYIDFDNIVIGRYDQVHGRNGYHRDRARAADTGGAAETEFDQRLQQATVDLGADHRLRLVVRHARAHPRLRGLVRGR